MNNRQLLNSERRRCPAEIIRDIGLRINNVQDLANFAKCNKAAYDVAEPELWALDMELPGKPALYWAIENNDLTVAEKALTKYSKHGVRGLLDGTGVAWTTFSWRGGKPAQEAPGSPVMLAVESGSMDMLRLVVSFEAAGCSLNMRCRMWPHGPDGWCVHDECDPDMCRGRLHFRRPNDPNWEEDPISCETALHLAVWAARPDMLRFLLERGADVGFKGMWQEIRNLRDCRVPLRDTLAGSAERRGIEEVEDLDPAHKEMVEVLQEYGVNMSSPHRHTHHNRLERSRQFMPF